MAKTNHTAYIGNLARMIRDARIKADITGGALGALLGYPKNISTGATLICAWENGIRTIYLTEGQKRPIAKLLSISVEELTVLLADELKARQQYFNNIKNAVSSKLQATLSLPTKEVAVTTKSDAGDIVTLSLVSILKTLCLKENSLEGADPEAILRVVRDAKIAARILGVSTTELDSALRAA